MSGIDDHAFHLFIAGSHSSAEVGHRLFQTHFEVFEGGHPF